MEITRPCELKIEFDSYVPCEKAQANPCYPVEFTAAMHQIAKELRRSDIPKEKMMGMLRLITNFYQADRAHIIEVDWDLYIGNASYEYCAPDIAEKKAALQGIDLLKFPRWHEATKQGAAIIIEDIEEICDSEPAEYDFLKAQGVANLLGIPLYEDLPGYFVITNPRRYATETVMMSVGAYIFADGFVKENLQKAVSLKSRNYPKLAPNEIEINFFGGMEVITPTGVMNEERMKSSLSAQLIAFLYFSWNRKAYSKDICSALWPDGLSVNPGKQLANQVWITNQKFGLICKPAIIKREGNSYGLNREFNFISDLDKFENFCKSAKAESDIQNKINTYKKAFDLYKGSVLPNFAHVERIHVKEVFYRMMYTEAVSSCLSEMYMASMYCSISILATHALAFEPTNADMLYYQMKAHLNMNGKEAVKRQFRTMGKYLSENQQKEIEEILAS